MKVIKYLQQKTDHLEQVVVLPCVDLPYTDGGPSSKNRGPLSTGTKVYMVGYSRLQFIGLSVRVTEISITTVSNPCN